MLRKISNQLQGSCVGPVNKVLNANNHDSIGNALETRQQIQDGTHGVVIYTANVLVIGTLATGFSNFTLSGTNYVISTLQVVYYSASYGGYPYFLLATNTSSSESATILTDLQNSGLDETMSVEFVGSRGTEIYSASASNKWQAAGTDVSKVAFPLINSNTTSGLDDNSFLSWEANSAYWGRAGSHNQTDTTSVVTLIT